MRFLRFLPVFSLVLAALAPAGIRGQTVLLDEGRFDIFVEERQVGTETFTIHRIGLGGDSEILATATVEVAGRTLRPALKTSPQYLPLSYQNAVSGGSDTELSVVLSGTRYQSRLSGPEGDMEREYRAGEGSILLEGTVAHQYFFLARSAPGVGDRLRVIVPMEGRQLPLQIRSVETEDLRLGREVVSARHFTITVGDAERHLWVDDEGRVLRVEIPAEGWVAERVSQR